MTMNKRFSVYGKEIVQGDECWAVAYSEYNADVIATALNELNDENQLLLKASEKDSELIKTLRKGIHQWKKENEQLKQQVEDLEFELRTIKAFDRTVKEEHSDTVYDFRKKLEKW